MPERPPTMHAMRLMSQRRPLVHTTIPVPSYGDDQVLIRVHACGVCRTDLHILDGDLTQPKLPLIPGHEIVGTIEAVGRRVDRLSVGDRIGVPWLGGTCGRCNYCATGRENLCDAPSFTGYDVDGGYAGYAVASQDFCFAITGDYTDAEAAPLLCAGLIGYRSLVMAGDARDLGIMGFGAAAHILAQVAVFEGRSVYAFSRPGDNEAQAFARRLGAVWAGGSDETPPTALDAVIIFAPVGPLVPAALKILNKGGIVVCGGIHMSDIPAFPYDLLWGERRIVSVANLTRADGEAFLRLAPRVPVRTEIETYPLADANLALERLRNGQLQGAAVLRCEE